MNYVDAPLFARPQYRMDCARGALHLLRIREERYPAAITAGRMTAAQAATGLELMRCVAAQWRWIVDPSAPPPPPFDDHTGLFGAHNWLLAEELAGAARRARSQSDRAPDNSEASHLASLCEALAWLQRCDYSRSGDARIVVAVRCERTVPGPTTQRALAA